MKGALLIVSAMRTVLAIWFIYPSWWEIAAFLALDIAHAELVAELTREKRT